jgi:hypothetical protein
MRRATRRGPVPMRRVRSQFLQSVVRLWPVVRGRGVSGGAAGVRSSRGTGARVVASAGLVAAFLAVAIGMPSAASAVPKANLGSFGMPNGAGGAQLPAPNTGGVAVNRTGNGGLAGSVYVAEGHPNHRISQFSADGEFIRAWGFDVVASGPGDAGTGFEVCEAADGDVCKAGVAGGAAGQLGNPMGIAIDQSNGFLYVTSVNNRRVDVFSGSGEFAGAFGWDVDPGGVVGPEVCTTACQAAGAAGGDAGRFSFAGSAPLSIPAVDPNVPGRIYVPDSGGLRVAEYSTSIVGGVLASASFVKAFGWDVVSSGPGTRTFDRSERQQIALSAGLDFTCFCSQPITGGTFTLSFDPDGGGAAPAETTGPIAFNASAAAIEARLVDDLASIAPGDVAVAGGPGPGTAWTVDFAGTYADTDVAQITGAGGALTPTADLPPSVSVTTPIAGGTFPDYEVCVPGDGDVCKVGVSGSENGRFATGSPSAAAVDGNGAIYVVSGPTFNNCTAAAPCRVQKFAPDASSATDFGPTAGTGQLKFTSGTAQTVAAMSVAVDLSNDHVFVQRRASAASFQVLEYDSDGNYIETHPQGDPLPAISTGNNAKVGLAVGTADRLYTSIGGGGAQVFILGVVPDPEVVMAPVTNVGASTARFDGSVTVPSPGFATTYHFEYSSNGVAWTSAPVPDESVGDAVAGTYPVSLEATGLQPCTSYLARVVASTGNAGVPSNAVPFVTDCVAPRVADTFVEEVTQTGVRLGAYVDPEGSATTYRFEWGTEPCSDIPNPCTEVPAFERQLGSGNAPLAAKEPIGGLSAATTYHYRVAATNAQETTYGPDRSFETLNSCGLTQDRCHELVSPPDKGAAGAAGDSAAVGQEPRFQAAPDGSALQYVLAYGLPDATAGEEQPYLARRGPSGWTSTQLGAPALAASPGGSGGLHSRARGYSSDLSCGVFASDQPLVDDAPQAVLDAGYSLLYRRDAAGSWTTVTDRISTSPGEVGDALTQGYMVVGMSEGPSPGPCERIVFRTRFEYEGVPAAGTFKTYVWEDGALEQVAVIPGPAGPECPGGACVVESVPGQASLPTDSSSGGGQPDMSNTWNAVSDDASRVFFTAFSRVGGDLGRQAVFLREQGSEVAVDVSQSKTGQPNNDASTYQAASVDGSRVFFIARSGLAANDPSPALSAGCDNRTIGFAAETGAGCSLYRFSVGGDGVAGTGDDELIDVSVPEPGIANGAGASVFGVLGASDDGSRVYFAARGRLVPGEGRSEAQNLARGERSVYLWDEGQVSYVGQVRNNSVDGRLVVTTSLVELEDWTTQVSPDGRYVAFESSASPTEYDTGGQREAYLYSADSNRLECLSCRRDGQPSADLATEPHFEFGRRITKEMSPPRSLAVDGDGNVRVFFRSRDRLASGATQGQPNLYEWKGGQVSLLASTQPGTTKLDLQFAGSSASGDDVYFTTIDQLTWRDVDGKMDVYDARVGGGDGPPPPAAEVPCDSLAGACQGPGAGELGGGVETGSGGGEDVSLPARATVRVAALGRVQRARLVAGRRVGVTVRVSGPGMLSVRGVASIGGLRARVLSASRRAEAAGRVTVPVVLSRPARRRIARTGGLRVVLTVRLDGAAKPVGRTLRLSKAKPKAKSRRSKANDKRGGRSQTRDAGADRRAGQ